MRVILIYPPFSDISCTIRIILFSYLYSRCKSQETWRPFLWIHFLDHRRHPWPDYSGVEDILCATHLFYRCSLIDVQLVSVQLLPSFSFCNLSFPSFVSHASSRELVYVPGMHKCQVPSKAFAQSLSLSPSLRYWWRDKWCTNTLTRCLLTLSLSGSTRSF